MSLLINCRLPDAKYSSQSKTMLTSPKPIVNISESEIKPMEKWDLFDRLHAALESKLYKTLSKDERKRKGRIIIDNGVDANEAGGKNSNKCILYIVEGKSASAYPKKRIEYSPGNKDFAGYYPIRGKFPNVMKMSKFQIVENKEIKEIKTYLGLRDGVNYDDPKEKETLRYGIILLTTDMDTDGSHIRMLLISFFHERYPSIIRQGMIGYLITFAVKLFDKKKCVGRFPTESDYERWAKLNPDTKLTVKYYKGLGTSTNADIKDDMTNSPVVICIYDDQAQSSIDMAFGKDNSDMRKTWISQFRDSAGDDEPIYVSLSDLYKYRNITDIINKDLVNYTLDSLFRSITSSDDLMKKSQRQSFYFMLKNWKYGHSKAKSMKIDRIGAAAAELSHYHHGPTSMGDTIVRMCQDYVGSNNLPMYSSEGQMGTRDDLGQDAAAARYTETSLEWWLKYVVHEEIISQVPRRVVEQDFAEPEWIPMDIPIGLINGFSGMATGHSTFCPPHSPYDIIDYILYRCCDKTPPALVPKFRKFTGPVRIEDRKVLKIPFKKEEDDEIDIAVDKIDLGDDAYDDDEIQEYVPPRYGKRTLITEGIMKIIKTYPDGSVDILITELPIGLSMHKYQLWLKKLELEKVIKGFKDNSTTDTCLYTIYNYKSEKVPNIYNLKLKRTFSLDNITLIDTQGYPTKYNSVEAAVDTYMVGMLDIYEKYRLNKIKELNEKVMKLNFERLFIIHYINGNIFIRENNKSVKKDVVYAQMDVYGIPHEIFDKIKMSRFTDEEIVKLEGILNETQLEMEKYGKMNAKSMWYDNLIIFREQLVKHGYTC